MNFDQGTKVHILRSPTGAIVRSLLTGSLISLSPSFTPEFIRVIYFTRCAEGNCCFGCTVYVLILEPLNVFSILHDCGAHLALIPTQ